MRTRIHKLAWLSLCLLLAPAAPAAARDNGEGLAGELTDKYVTFFSLGVTLFFVVVVIVGTIIQSRLEKRKQEKKAALRHRTGW
jgi:hypothetical protein